jgi:hypothetical protein
VTLLDDPTLSLLAEMDRDNRHVIWTGIEKLSETQSERNHAYMMFPDKFDLSWLWLRIEIPAQYQTFCKQNSEEHTMQDWNVGEIQRVSEVIIYENPDDYLT